MKSTTTTSYKDQGKDGNIYLLADGEIVVKHRHTDTCITLPGMSFRGSRGVAEFFEGLDAGVWAPPSDCVHSRESLSTQRYSSPTGDVIDLEGAQRLTRYVSGELTLFTEGVDLSAL